MQEERVQINEETGEVIQPEEREANVFEREELLGFNATVPKDERDKLWMEIKNMSDEELKAAIENEKTEIPEGDGMAAPTTQEHSKDQQVFNPMAVALEALDPSDYIKLYELATKANSDPEYNVVAELPKDIYALMETQAKALGLRGKRANGFIRAMVIDLGKEIAFDKECKAFMDELKAATEIPEILDMHGEHMRETYEIKMLEDANNMELDLSDETREKMRSISKAFTDSYTLSRQMELLNDDVFINKIPKLLKKKLNRMCDDFDYILSKTIISKASVKEINGLMDHILKVGDTKTAIFILFLCELTKNANKDNTPETMFMYASLYNIRTLATVGDVKSDFAKEKIEYLKKFFDALSEKMDRVFTLNV